MANKEYQTPGWHVLLLKGLWSALKPWGRKSKVVVCAGLIGLLYASPANADWYSLANVSATTEGSWIQYSDYAGGAIDVTITGTATVVVNVSNAQTRPTDATNGQTINRTATATGILTVPGGFRWLKVRVTVCSACTVIALLEANRVGGAESFAVQAGGQSGAAAVTSFTNCTGQVNLRMTTATTTELVALTSGELVRLCGIVLLADGDTDVTIVEGTGTNCGTGQGTLLGPLDLTSTNGRGFVVQFGITPFIDGAAAGNAICITSSAAVNLTIFTRYAKY